MHTISPKGGNKRIQKKDKTFSLNKMILNLFMKLKQFREREPKKGSSSEEERKVNALALGAEEGRDKLRKAAGSCK